MLFLFSFLKVVESMSKSAFLDMLKSSSDKARTQEINKEQVKVISVIWYRSGYTSSYSLPKLS